MPSDLPLWATIAISSANAALISGAFNWYLAARVKANVDTTQMQSSAIYKIQMDISAAYFTATSNAKEVASSVLDESSPLATEEIIKQLKGCQDEIQKSFALAPIYFPFTVEFAFRENANIWKTYLSSAVEILGGSVPDEDGSQMEFIRSTISRGFHQSQDQLIGQLKRELLPEVHTKRHQRARDNFHKIFFKVSSDTWWARYKKHRWLKKNSYKKPGKVERGASDEQ